MRRAISTSLIPFDPEIERTCRRNRKIKRNAQMAEEPERHELIQPMEHPLDQYDMPVTTRIGTSIAGNNFIMKDKFTYMVSKNMFAGRYNEDPLNHLKSFIRTCSGIKQNGLTDDDIQLALFCYTLQDDAIAWLDSYPNNYFTTWDQLSREFMEQFYPPDKTNKMRNALMVFSPLTEETLAQAWERFKKMQRECPHHGLTEWMLINSFYNGLRESTRNFIDAAAGGYFKGLTATEGTALLNRMARNRGHPTARAPPTKIAAGMHEVSTETKQESKMDQMMIMMKAMMEQTKSLQIQPELMAGETEEEVEQAQYVQNNPYSERYNPGWRNHPNFSWKEQTPNNQPPPFQQQGPPGFPNKPPGQQQPQYQKKEISREEFDELKGDVKSMKSMMSKICADIDSRQSGSLPSQTEPNPREHVKAVTTRSGLECKETEKSSRPIDEPIEEIDLEEAPEKKKEVKAYVPPMPFPGRLQKEKYEKQFKDFCKVLKDLHINIPFADALTQIPMYAKFLKEIMAKKRKIDDSETIMLTEQCSAIIKNNLPEKMKDPGSFTIPCIVGKLKIAKALCDLGASVSLMPLSVAKKLGLNDIRKTNVTLQLADRSTTKPTGIAEDVLVKVENFYIPVDFIVLDMPEDHEMPLILGRPFLATAGAIIDVKKGKLTLKLGGDEIEFNMFDLVKHPKASEDCFRIDLIEELVEEATEERRIADEEEAFEIAAIEKQICAFGPVKTRLPREELKKGANLTLPVIVNSGKSKETTSAEIGDEKSPQIQVKSQEENEEIKVGDIVQVTTRSSKSSPGKLLRISLGPFKVIKINKHGKVEVQHERNGKYSFEKKHVKRCQFVLRKIKYEGNGSSSTPLGKPPE